MIDVSAVELSFGDVSVLSGVDLRVDAGEFVALVGPNGAGKTTLLRTINGLIDPDGGSVTLAGEDVSALSTKEVSRQVATVPQDTHVGFSFTAEQIVEMGRTPHRSRLDWSEETAPVERALERTEMRDLRDRPVDDLSGGERQRVLLARALAQEPSALLLDEPTANLDINHQTQVLGLVSDLADDGRAALAAIHDLDLAARFCDRLLLLADGEIRAEGPPGDVLTDPALETAFGTRTAVTRNPVTGTPTVAAVREASDEGHIHVAGGGEGATRALRTLWRAGYAVTLGPVPQGDRAAQLADDLGCRTVSAPPFRPLSDGRRQEALDCTREAAVLVLTSGPGSETVSRAQERTPRIRADLSESTADAATRAVGDGGATADGQQSGVVRTVESEQELLVAVREHLDDSE